MSHQSLGVQFALLFASAAFLAGLESWKQPVQAAAPDKVTICHATASNSNPYVQITVNDDAVDGNGNDSADHNRDGHQNGEDIIPPGAWDTAGRNWDAQGQAIWNNQCTVPISTPGPTATPTPSIAPTPSATPTPTPTPAPTPSVSPGATPTPSPTPSSNVTPSPTPQITGVGGPGDETDCCPGRDPEQPSSVVTAVARQPRLAGVTTQAPSPMTNFPSAGPAFATHFVHALAFLASGWAAQRIS